MLNRRSFLAICGLGSISALSLSVNAFSASKPMESEDYDDRNLRVCQIVCEKFGFTYAPDIEVASELEAAHLGGNRNPQTIRQSMKRVSKVANDCEPVFLVDDIITTGGHFEAAKQLLMETGCNKPINGLFLALAQEIPA